MKRLIQWFYFFEKFIDQWWYAPVLGLLAALDHYVLVFPLLGMLISSIFLKPKKWLSLTLWTAFGSWFGALVLALIVKHLGLSFIMTYFPVMLENSVWEWTQEFFRLYGVWIVFLVGLAPMPQQPPVIISSLAGVSLEKIASVLLMARLIKFSLIGYLASHAPEKLNRFRSLRKELKELDVEAPVSREFKEN